MAQKRNTSGLLGGGMIRTDNPRLASRSYAPPVPGGPEPIEGVDLSASTEYEKMRWWALREPVRLCAEFDPE
mgnify:CR=1 FL=1